MPKSVFNADTRPAFTLVELLAVVAVVALLCCLALPRMNYSGGHSRQTWCLNNLNQIGRAALAYEQTKGHYPGYLNPKLNSGAPHETSWYIALLSMMDRPSLYQTWIEQPIGKSPYFEMYFCPSDDTGGQRDQPFVSYVLNTGKPGHDVAQIANPKFDGVSHDLSNQNFLPARGLSAKDFVDGLDRTMLASENLDADQYLPKVNDPEDVFGMSWGGTQYKINQLPAEGRRNSFAIQDFRYARPSSNHGGIINVVFAASNTKSIDENIDIKVWNALMTPNGQQVEPQFQIEPSDGNH